MTKYQITAPNGQKFVITAPEGATAEQAYAAFQRAHPAAEGGAAFGPEDTRSPAKKRYDDAIQGVRGLMPDVSDEQFDLMMHGRKSEGILENTPILGPIFAPETFSRPGLAEPYNAGDVFKSGQLFGFGDEIAAAAQALTTNGGDYGKGWQVWQELNAAREQLGKEEMGMLAPLAEVAGGLTSFGAGPLISAATQAGRVAPSALRTGLTSAAAGAGLGSVYGFGATDGDVGDRAVGALEGAAFGGATGAAAPFVADLVGAGVNNLRSAWGADRAARQAGMTPEAARFLETRLQADDALGPVGHAAMSRAGNEAMLIDAGPSAVNTLDYAIQSSGGAGRVAREAIDARVGRDAQAIQDALNQTLGLPQGVETSRAAVRQATAGARGDTYRAAYEQPIDYSSQSGQFLEELLGRVDPAVIRRANALMRTRGEESAQILAQFGDDGTVTFSRLPDVRQIDYITRALNEEASAGIGQGAMGGQTTLGSALEDLSRDLRSVLRNHVPEYDAALRTGQSAIQQTQAIQRGSQLLRTNRETVADWTRNLSPEERAGMLQGVRSQIDDTLARVTRAVSDGDMEAREAIKALRDLSSRQARENLAMAIGDDVEAGRFFDEIDRATQSFERRAAVADNSRTFQRQEMGRQVQDIADPDNVLTALGKGKPVNAGQRVAQALTGLTPERALARQDQVLTEVVRALTAQGIDRQSVIGALNQVRQGRVGSQQVMDVARAISRFGGPVGYLSGQQALGSQ